MSAELFAFLLASLAGLATLAGAGLALLQREHSPRLLAGSLAFAAGAMLLVSLWEILPEAAANLGAWWPVLFLAGAGALLVVAMQAGLEKLAPDRGRHSRVGLLVALAIGLHNLPEGAAPFVSALASPEAGLVIALAIALHNIPEGIAVVSPMLAGGASRAKALAFAAVAGLAEAVGALIAWLFVAWLSAPVIGGMLALVGGIMVWLSLAELLPAARRATRGPAPVYGTATGIAAMALSLLALG
ncbi:MAG: ZIP family metal transporter [Planctomycetota bacterium]|nr:ZIP family metal transporter [Planctomycetota bacterium]